MKKMLAAMAAVMLAASLAAVDSEAQLKAPSTVQTPVVPAITLKPAVAQPRFTVAFGGISFPATSVVGEAVAQVAPPALPSTPRKTTGPGKTGNVEVTKFIDGTSRLLGEALTRATVSHTMTITAFSGGQPTAKFVYTHAILVSMTNFVDAQQHMQERLKFNYETETKVAP